MPPVIAMNSSKTIPKTNPLFRAISRPAPTAPTTPMTVSGRRLKCGKPPATPLFLSDFEKRVREYKPQPRRRGSKVPVTGRNIDADWDWSNVRNLGMFTYLLSGREGKNSQLYGTLKNDLIAVADSIADIAAKDIYGRPLGDRYYWGCNGTWRARSSTCRSPINLSPKRNISAPVRMPSPTSLGVISMAVPL